MYIALVVLLVLDCIALVALILVQQGKGADAATVYDGIAGNASVPTQYRDLATLLGVMQRADGGDPAQLTAKLQPLTADTSPWRFSARELTAMLAARAGDTEKARTLYKQLADDQQAPSGVRGRDYKALAFAVSGFFAGIGGSLLAHQYTYIDPTIFTMLMSLLVVTIVILGGVGLPYGAVVGSIVLIGAMEVLRFTPELRIIVYGLVLILVVRFRPGGILVRNS